MDPYIDLSTHAIHLYTIATILLLVTQLVNEVVSKEPQSSWP